MNECICFEVVAPWRLNVNTERESQAGLRSRHLCCALR